MLKGDLFAFIRDARHIAAVPNKFRGYLIWLYEPLRGHFAGGAKELIGRIRAGWFAAGGWGSILWFQFSPAAILPG